MRELIIKRNGIEIESMNLPVGEIELWIDNIRIATIK